MCPRLLPEDLIRCAALEREEILLRQRFTQDLQRIAREASRMMDELSEKEGIDLRLCEVDWETGEYTLTKPQPERVQ